MRPVEIAVILNSQFDSVFKTDVIEVAQDPQDTYTSSSCLSRDFRWKIYAPNYQPLIHPKHQGLTEFTCESWRSVHLVLLFHSSWYLSLSGVSDIWRLAIVTPIFKKGSGLDLSNIYTMQDNDENSNENSLRNTLLSNMASYQERPVTPTSSKLLIWSHHLWTKGTRWTSYFSTLLRLSTRFLT